MIACVHASVLVHHGAGETCQVCASVRLFEDVAASQEFADQVGIMRSDAIGIPAILRLLRDWTNKWTN
jgi:hypothetical protein